MKRRQIVPLDGSEAAEAALAYAEGIPSEQVLLLHCVPAGADRNRQQAEAYLERQAARFTVDGRSVEISVVEADPARTIVETAGASDLIVMTTHGRGAGKRAIFGSVADRVARHAASPALLVRGGEQPIATASIRRIVAGLDGSERAERALTIVGELATALDIPVQLIRVLDMRRIEQAIQAGTYAGIRLAAAGGEIRAAYATYLTARAAELTDQGLTVSTAVLDGAPAEQISAATEPGDVIAITSQGRGGVARWMLGSVADKLVRTAPVPVLLAR